MKKTFFITFEGGEGSGKSTILKLIKSWLNDEAIDFIETREPGGCSISEQIREVIVNKENTMMDSTTEAMLYASARCQHLKEVIRPALEEGKMVLCDRYIDSNFVYQGYSRGLGIEKIYEINKVFDFIEPDLTIYFDLDPEVGLKRVNSDPGREINRLDLEKIEFHKRVREGYLKLSNEIERIKVVDAGKSIEEVFNDVKKLIEDKIKEL